MSGSFELDGCHFKKANLRGQRNCAPKSDRQVPGAHLIDEVKKDAGGSGEAQAIQSDDSRAKAEALPKIRNRDETPDEKEMMKQTNLQMKKSIR